MVAAAKVMLVQRNGTTMKSGKEKSPSGITSLRTPGRWEEQAVARQHEAFYERATARACAHDAPKPRAFFGFTFPQWFIRPPPLSFGARRKRPFSFPPPPLFSLRFSSGEDFLYVCSPGREPLILFPTLPKVCRLGVGFSFCLFVCF